MSHIVLLGDSIFDNAPYVQDEPDVIAQLRSKLPNTWTASLSAVDGDRISDVYAQLDKMNRSITPIRSNLHHQVEKKLPTRFCVF